MVKAHSSIGWKNDPSTDTPVNETNLNQMDNTIGVLDDRIIVLDSTKATKTEVSTLIANISFDENTGIFTFTKKNGSTFTVDTKLEKLAVNFAYDETNERLVITLSDGTVQYVDISSLIRLQEFVDSDTIAFTVTNNSVTARIKENSITDEMLESGYLGQIKLEVETVEESAANAKVSEENAKVSELNAKASEENAKASEIEANNLAQEIKSKVSDANESAANASTHANAAQESANLAVTKANEASASAVLASEKSDIAVSNASDAEQFASNAEQHATDALASSVNAEAGAVRAEEAAKRAESIVGGDFATNEKVDNIINGTTPVGNALQLGGKSASEYVQGVSPYFVSGETILDWANNTNGVYRKFVIGDVFPSDVPTQAEGFVELKIDEQGLRRKVTFYQFGTFDVFEREIFNGAWRADWSKSLATTADLANYLPLSGGTVRGAIISALDNSNYAGALTGVQSGANIEAFHKNNYSSRNALIVRNPDNGNFNDGLRYIGVRNETLTADHTVLHSGNIGKLREYLNVYADSSNAETYSSFIQNANGTHVRHVTDANNFDEFFIRQGKITYAKMANGTWSETEVIHSGNIDQYVSNTGINPNTAIMWNQLTPDDCINTSYYSDSFTGGIHTIKLRNSSVTWARCQLASGTIMGHKIYVRITADEDLCNALLYFYEDGTEHLMPEFSGQSRAIITPLSNYLSFHFSDYWASHTQAQLSINAFDLTLMFGAGNEPTIEEFDKTFPSAYYEYNAGIATTVSEVSMVNVLNGYLPLSGGVIDGDVQIGQQTTYGDTTARTLNFTGGCGISFSASRNFSSGSISGVNNITTNTLKVNGSISATVTNASIIKASSTLTLGNKEVATMESGTCTLTCPAEEVSFSNTSTNITYTFTGNYYKVGKFVWIVAEGTSNSNAQSVKMSTSSLTGFPFNIKYWQNLTITMYSYNAPAAVQINSNTRTNLLYSASSGNSLTLSGTLGQSYKAILYGLYIIG